MSEVPLGPGWWLASDGRFYPPETHPAASAPAPPLPAPAAVIAPASAPPVEPTRQRLPGMAPELENERRRRIGNGVRIARWEWAAAAAVVVVAALVVLLALAVGRHDPYGHHDPFASTPTTRPLSQGGQVDEMLERQTMRTPPGSQTLPTPPPALRSNARLRVGPFAHARTTSRVWSSGDGLWFAVSLVRVPAGGPDGAEVEPLALTALCPAPADIRNGPAPESEIADCAGAPTPFTAMVGVARWPTVVAVAVLGDPAGGAVARLAAMVAQEYGRIVAPPPSTPQPAPRRGPLPVWLEILLAAMVVAFTLGWGIGTAQGRVTGKGPGPAIIVLVVVLLNVPGLVGLWVGSRRGIERVQVERRARLEIERRAQAEERRLRRDSPEALASAWTPPEPTASGRTVTDQDVHDKQPTRWLTHHRAGRGSVVVVLLALALAGYTVVQGRADVVSAIHRHTSAVALAARHDSPTSVARDLMAVVFASGSTPGAVASDVTPADRPAFSRAVANGEYSIPGFMRQPPPYVEGSLESVTYALSTGKGPPARAAQPTACVDVDATLNVTGVQPNGAAGERYLTGVVTIVLTTTKVGDAWYVDYPWPRAVVCPR